MNQAKKVFQIHKPTLSGYQVTDKKKIALSGADAFGS